MPPRELIWDKTAAQDLEQLLGRRSDRDGVLGCIEHHLLAVAADASTAELPGGPLRELVHRFQCYDGLTVLYLMAVFAFAPPNRIAVLHFKSQEF